MKHTHRYLLYFADVNSFPAGHDPATFDLEGRYSIQLNYGNILLLSKINIYYGSDTTASDSEFSG